MSSIEAPLLWALALTATRTGLALGLTTLFSAGWVGWALRLGLTMALAAALWPLIGQTALTLTATSTRWPIAAVLHEVIAGLTIGLTLRVVLSLGRVTASLLEASAAPHGSAASGGGRWIALGGAFKAIGVPYHLGFLAIFFALGGPITLIEALARTFDVVPLGGQLGEAGLISLFTSALDIVGGLFMLAVGAIAPVLLALTALELGLGLSWRPSPQLTPGQEFSEVARTLLALAAMLLALRPGMLWLSAWLFETLSAAWTP